MKLHYLEAKNARPAKKFSVGKNNRLEVTSYPNIKDFTSYEETVENPAEFYESLKRNSLLGTRVLLKGLLDRPLEDESRAGHVNRTQRTEWLVLDVDGTTETDISKIVALVGLEKFSYVIQYSSSYGIERDGDPVKPGLRCHIYFMLEEPISPALVKHWLKTINLRHFQDDMGLMGTGFSLEWPIDPSVADNSKLIYIASAICVEPYRDSVSTDTRIVLIETKRTHVPISKLKAMALATIGATASKLIAKRRSDAALPKRSLRTKHIGKATIIVDKPDPGTLHFVGSDRGFSYYNLNHGDSAAYYHPIGKPDVVHSFKPEDYSFRHEDVDLESYATAQERASDYRLEQGETLRGVGRDISVNKFFSYAFDQKANTLLKWEITKDNIPDHLANHDLLMPDPVPDYHVRFDPADDRVFDPSDCFINSFSDNDYGRTYRGISRDSELTLDVLSAHLNIVAPYTAALMYHVLGNDKQIMNWFINWLGHMMQARTKPGTALVIHGVPGTGKNVLMERVLRPIFGGDYFIEIRMDHLNDSFTGWMQQARLILINEANEISMTGDGSKTGEMLKNIITEERLSLRGMRELSKSYDTFFGVILASNSHTPLLLDASDRRFSVCTRQEQPLVSIGDYDIKKNFFDLVEQWDTERAAFAKMLYSVTVDDTQVHSAVENYARQTMIESGKTSTDEFCDAVRAGNLDYFLEAIPDDSLQTTFSTTILTMANTNKLLLHRFIESVAGGPISVSSDELRLLYMMMTGAHQNVNPIRFGRMMAKHGLPLKSGIRDEKRRKGTFRGMRLNWKLVSTTVDEALSMVDTAWRSSSTNLSAMENVPDFLLQ
ncbi:MAG TPA: hypothetical protein EYQ14_25870 [Gammaproteobacteria bacterium]|nr:hypothetical protein [Gammaproteobacteria bacterium]